MTDDDTYINNSFACNGGSIKKGHTYLAKIRKYFFFYEQPFEIKILETEASGKEVKISIENIHDLISSLSTAFKHRYHWIKMRRLKIIGEISSSDQSTARTHTKTMSKTTKRGR